jgi:hypothetical protein
MCYGEQWKVRPTVRGQSIGRLFRRAEGSDGLSRFPFGYVLPRVGKDALQLSK